MTPRQRQVYVVLRKDFLLLDLACVVEPLRLANELLGVQQYVLHYVGSSAEVGSSVSIAVGPVAPLPVSLPDDALVVLVGTQSATLEQNRRLQPPVVRWLRETVRPSHLVVCVCSGAILAAEAGLLDGRECTTHHDFCEQLSQTHPLAKVRENRLFIRDGNVFTSAGVTAGLDLTLFLLGLLDGDELALGVARQLVVYTRRAGDDPQRSPLLAHRNHLHPLVHRVQDEVLLRPGHTWTVASLAKLVHVSTRQLTRLFVECTGTTPMAWVTVIRVARARERLDTSGLSIERIAEECGFGSARQFRRTFQAQLGRSPAHWRREHAELRSAQ